MEFDPMLWDWLAIVLIAIAVTSGPMWVYQLHNRQPNDVGPPPEPKDLEPVDQYIGRLVDWIRDVHGIEENDG